MDYTTSHVFYVAFLALYAAVLAVIAVRSPKVVGTRWFAISVLLELGKTLLQSLGYGAPRLLTILLANELNIADFFFLCLGMRWFAGRRDRGWTQAAALLTVLFMALYAAFFMGRVPYSFPVMGVAVLLLCGAALRAVWRERNPRFRAPARVVAGLLVAQMLLLGYRMALAVEAYRSARMVRLTWSDPRWMYSMLGLMVVGTAFLGTYLWLTAIELHAQLADRAERDGLTGCLNRACFMDRGPRTLARYAREGRAPSVVILDLDHFKAINDQWGHAAGDTVLQTVGETLSATLHDGQLLARMGGEEFAVLLGERSAGAGLATAEQLLAAIRQLRVPVGGTSLEIRMSGGVAEVAGGESWESALLRADQALYRAKAAGRNQLVLAQPGRPSLAGNTPLPEACALELSEG